MQFRDFQQLIYQHLEAPLAHYGYTIVSVPAFEQSVLFRKVLPPWFLYLNFQYNHRSLPRLGRFDVHLTRLLVDKPYGQYIRDQNGIYIPGSLVSGISSPDGPGWLYTSISELGTALDKALGRLEEQLPWLEAPGSTLW